MKCYVNYALTEASILFANSFPAFLRVKEPTFTQTYLFAYVYGTGPYVTCVPEMPVFHFHLSNASQFQGLELGMFTWEIRE
jgi:hypothetical protein